MEHKKVEEISKLSFHRKSLREKRKIKQSIWGSLFLEILVRKIWEDELQEISRCCAGEKTEPKRQETGEGARKKEAAAERCGYPSWRNADRLELCAEDITAPAVSENYNEFIRILKCRLALSCKKVYRTACETMEYYYEASITRAELGGIFCGCVRNILDEMGTAGNWREAERKTVETVYEYFSRANACAAVRRNMREGKQLVEEAGLPWHGTTYYNSDYYYAWNGLQEWLLEFCAYAAKECGMGALDFARIERRSVFRFDGGLSYHGVWNWAQSRNNYPNGQYGMRDESKKPPEHFIFLYRNWYSKEEQEQIACLRKKINGLAYQKRLRSCSFKTRFISGGREYHDGMSYLLDAEEEWIPEAALAFLTNFRLFRLSGCAEIMFAGLS